MPIIVVLYIHNKTKKFSMKSISCVGVCDSTDGYLVFYLVIIESQVQPALIKSTVLFLFLSFMMPSLFASPICKYVSSWVPLRYFCARGEHGFSKQPACAMPNGGNCTWIFFFFFSMLIDYLW